MAGGACGGAVKKTSLVDGGMKGFNVPARESVMICEEFGLMISSETTSEVVDAVVIIQARLVAARLDGHGCLFYHWHYPAWRTCEGEVTVSCKIPTLEE